MKRGLTLSHCPEGWLWVIALRITVLEILRVSLKLYYENFILMRVWMHNYLLCVFEMHILWMHENWAFPLRNCYEIHENAWEFWFCMIIWCMNILDFGFENAYECMRTLLLFHLEDVVKILWVLWEKYIYIYMHDNFHEYWWFHWGKMHEIHEFLKNLVIPLGNSWKIFLLTFFKSISFLQSLTLCFSNSFFLSLFFFNS